MSAAAAPPTTAACDNDGPIFISRAGADNVFAIWLHDMLEGQGYTIILQDTDFKSRNFIDAMHEALKTCSAVLAVYSPDYLESDYCMAEAQAAMGDDLFNRGNRFHPLMLRPCMPDGLLRRIPYASLMEARRNGDPLVLARTVLEKLNLTLSDPAKVPALPEGVALSRVPTVDRGNIFEQKFFTGRGDLVAWLQRSLAAGQTAQSNTRHAALTASGLGGVGKSTLARQFAWLHQDDYEGVWWVRAAEPETMLEDLIALGEAARVPGIRALAEKNLDGAGRTVLNAIESTQYERPWLIVYDNVERPAEVEGWFPTRNAHVLFTSRALDFHGLAEVVNVDVFEPETAVDFLLERSGRTKEAHREAAGRLAEDLQYLPLALDHAGSYCFSTGMEFDAYRANLADLLRKKPMGGASAGRYPESVYGTFTLAFEKAVAACPEAERLMALIAFLDADGIPVGFLPDTIMGAVERGEAAAALQAVALLRLNQDADGGPAIITHRLVQAVMRSRLEETGAFGATAAQAARIVFDAYDFSSGSMLASERAARWLPQALAALETVPSDGAAAYNIIWTRIFLGDLRLVLGDTEAALGAYEKVRTQLEHLAAADPGNAEWQRDLSVSHNKIGNVLRAQGNLTGALQAFQASLEIAKGLAAADPGNTGWQRDLSVSQEKIGDVLRAQGNLTGALQAFQASIEIRKGLAAADPGNAGWQRDLAVSHAKVASAMQAIGDSIAALQGYRDGREIIQRLCELSPDNAQLPSDLAYFEARIAEFETADSKNSDTPPPSEAPPPSSLAGNPGLRTRLYRGT